MTATFASWLEVQSPSVSQADISRIASLIRGKFEQCYRNYSANFTTNTVEPNRQALEEFLMFADLLGLDTFFIERTMRESSAAADSLAPNDKGKDHN